MVRRRASWMLTAILIATLPLAILARQVEIAEAKSEPSSTFECPAVGAQGVTNILTDWKDADFPLDADDIVTEDKIDELVRRVRNDNPGVSFPSLVDSLTAAYCPIVARQPLRSDAQKRAQLARFDKLLEQRIVAMKSWADDQILARVPLSPSVMHAVRTAAANRGETPTQWMSEVVGKAALEQK
jgi:hypothetical protein